MGLLDILQKGVQAMINEANTPERFKVGRAFEEYTREFLFVDNYYKLVERTHDYSTNRKDFVESTMKPDFTFRDNWTKKEFYLEAKFRSGLYKDKIMWCTDAQMARYKEYAKERPLFVLLGFGADPKYPEFLSLIPLAEAKYTGIFPSYAEKFAIVLDKAVTSKTLWNR